jgi:hypothetical protein
MTFKDSVKKLIMGEIDSASKDVRVLEDMSKRISIKPNESRLYIAAKSKEDTLRSILKEIMNID